LIQGNVPELGLDFNSRAEEVLNNHVIETRKALKGSKDVDFILWPENSVDVDPFINKKVFESLESFDSPLIIGAIVEQDKQLLNTSILWQETSQEIYVKRHLTPFGEYIPLRPLAELISPLTDRVNDFSPGDQQKTFVLGEAKIAPIICYELIDDQILQEAASNSNLFVVQTNSATFGMSAESAQQLSIARVRAIENSRNILSVSTTGYSAVIDYRGKILQKTSMATAEHLYADVGLINQESLRNRMGDWASVFTLIWVFIASRERWIIRR
jgi:apolipoprotein N-acyltransferase